MMSICLSGCNNGDISNQTSDTKQSQLIINTIRPIKDFDRVLSAAGPNASYSDLDKSSKLLQAGNLTNTYTYVRCYYSKNSYNNNEVDTAITHPETDYVWAKNENGSDFFKLYGYWYDDGLFDWANMFYTSTDLNYIKKVCNETIKDEVSKDKVSFYQVAADNRFSFNHTIWQNDISTDVSVKLNKVIAFGDSLSDNNNMFNGSDWNLPNSKSWFQGRFSNGYNWVEYLAKDMGLPIYNWAVGGAAGDEKYMVIPGLRQQVQSWSEYMNVAKNYDPTRSLVTILIGANDFVNYDISADKVLADVKDSIRILAEKRIKHIIILNLPDVTKAPVFHMGKDPAPVLERVTEYNRQLPIILDALRRDFPDLDIKMFDTKTALDDALANPQKYQLENTTDSCLEINEDSSTNYITTHNPRESCSDASKFIFWDTLHITTRTHQVLADEIRAFMSN